MNYLNLIDTAYTHFNRGDLTAYAEALYAPDVVAHFLPPELPAGRDGVLRFYQDLQRSFPDMRFELEGTVVQIDRVALRFHIDMTHKGDYNGLAATGKSVVLRGIMFLRFSDEQVRECWLECDFIGLLRQLGAATLENQY